MAEKRVVKTWKSKLSFWVPIIGVVCSIGYGGVQTGIKMIDIKTGLVREDDALEHVIEAQHQMILSLEKKIFTQGQSLELLDVQVVDLDDRNEFLKQTMIKFFEKTKKDIYELQAQLDKKKGIPFLPLSQEREVWQGPEPIDPVEPSTGQIQKVRTQQQQQLDEFQQQQQQRSSPVQIKSNYLEQFK
jgi:hypothetical protein